MKQNWRLIKKLFLKTKEKRPSQLSLGFQYGSGIAMSLLEQEYLLRPHLCTTTVYLVQNLIPLLLWFYISQLSRATFTPDIETTSYHLFLLCIIIHLNVLLWTFSHILKIRKRSTNELSYIYCLGSIFFLMLCFIRILPFGQQIFLSSMQFNHSLSLIHLWATLINGAWCWHENKK